MKFRNDTKAMNTKMQRDKAKQREKERFWRDVRSIAKEVKAWPNWKKGTVDRPPSGVEPTPPPKSEGEKA